MSSAPYTFWAIVLIFSTIGNYGKDRDNDRWKHERFSRQEESRKLDLVNTHLCDVRVSKSCTGLIKSFNMFDFYC